MDWIDNADADDHDDGDDDDYTNDVMKSLINLIYFLVFKLV